MSVVFESLESRSLFSASPALVDLRLDVATYKAELTASKKAFTAEVKTLTADLKRTKASQASKTVLAKSLASSITQPEAQVTKALNTLVTRAAAFVPASAAEAKKITIATESRLAKAQAALDSAANSESTLAIALYGSGGRLSLLATAATSVATPPAGATGDATTIQDAGTLSASVTSYSATFSNNQSLVTNDLSSLGATSVL